MPGPTSLITSFVIVLYEAGIVTGLVEYIRIGNLRLKTEFLVCCLSLISVPDFGSTFSPAFFPGTFQVPCCLGSICLSLP